MVTGIVGVYLSIKQKILAWPIFILCYASYVYISYRGNYYAFSAMNILLIGVAYYGWLNWSKAKKNGVSEVRISHLAPQNWWRVVLFVCFATLAIGKLLNATEEARLPYYDAFATACALTAQWMLSRKYVENWIFWLLADCVYLGFFINDRIWPSVILFSVFICLAIKGWREWRAIIRQTA